jgi:hypothetical protein
VLTLHVASNDEVVNCRSVRNCISFDSDVYLNNSIDRCCARPSGRHATCSRGLCQCRIAASQWQHSTEYWHNDNDVLFLVLKAVLVPVFDTCDTSSLKGNCKAVSVTMSMAAGIASASSGQ